MLAGLPFLATVILLFVLKPFARNFGLVDHPGPRKTHAEPTPLVGGAAITLGALATAVLVLPMTRDVVALGAASALMLIVGTIDDRYDINWRIRISAQAVAALILFTWGGVRVESIGGALGFSGHTLGVLALPFTILATVGITNAINWADGVDGLAGSLSLAAFVMLIAASIYAGNAPLANDLVLMAGCVMGFLAFNLRTPWRPHASVFLGDGAEILGLWIAWASFRLTQTPGHPVTPVLAPFLIAPPVIDCLVLIVRRLRARRSPFFADRNHLHHLLLDAGMSSTKVVALLAGLTLVIGFCAANARRIHMPEPLFPIVYLTAVGAYFLVSRRAGDRLAPPQPKPQLVVRPAPPRPDTAGDALGATVRAERSEI
ncbi:MAG TPA: MraY family glycosyltransferase [Caulobacteraceae bacterium]|nr:MraY family glycosyltransferase [Caulobacteraceae bacterium]